MPIRGNFEALARVRIGVDGLASNGLGRLVRVVGDAAVAELRAGFSEAHDPSGSAWKSTTDGRKPLQGFDRHWTLTLGRGVARLSSNHPGARAHQLGAVIVPRRRSRGRDTGGRFTTARGGVLAFVIGGAKVFARKVVLPKRRMTPRNGSLEGWARGIEGAVNAELALMAGVRR